jgi:hypothetical protein
MEQSTEVARLRTVLKAILDKPTPRWEHAEVVGRMEVCAMVEATLAATREDEK